MRFVVDQAALLRELTLVQGIIERKATLPSLANIVITATESGQLKILATDLEVGLRTGVAATVEEPGTIAVDAKRIHEIVRRLPHGNLSFREKDGVLHVNLERIRYRLTTHDTEDYPSLPVKEGNPAGTIRSSLLAEMVRRVLFAITTDDPRYSLGGALFRLEDGTLLLVSTDGHRLSLTERPAKRLDPEVNDLIVPRKALAEIGKLAADDEADTFFWVQAGTLFVQVGERELNTHLPETRFPDFTRVVPEGNDKIVEVGTADLKNALDRVSVLSQDQSRMVRFSLSPETLALSTEHHQHGAANEELSVDYDGEAIDIGFNAQYIADYLAVAGTETIRLKLGEEMGQGLIEPGRGDDDDAKDAYVVMPMALGS